MLQSPFGRCFVPRRCVCDECKDICVFVARSAVVLCALVIEVERCTRACSTCGCGSYTPFNGVEYAASFSQQYVSLCCYLSVSWKIFRIHVYLFYLLRQRSCGAHLWRQPRKLVFPVCWCRYRRVLKTVMRTSSVAGQSAGVSSGGGILKCQTILPPCKIYIPLTSSVVAFL